jgi:hypothetical protein
MDLEQLLRNIKMARDAAKEDAAAFGAQAETLKGEQRAGEMLSVVIAQRAAEAVDVALSRILGETRTGADT